MRLQTVGIVRALAFVLVSLGSSACSGAEGTGAEAGAAGGSGGESNGSTSPPALGACAVQAEVTGGTTITFTGKNDAACATLTSSERGLDMIFIGENAKGTLEVIVDDVAEGETLADYPAKVVVTSTAKEHWQGAGCVASLSEHRLVKTDASELGELRHYQVSGAGTCREPLDSVPTGNAAVTLDAFAFRAEVTWRD